MTVDEVVKICGRDQVFYNGSNGGVTLSGGEPLLQYRFTASLIDALKQAGINVALETSGYLEWALLKRVIEKADQILLDIKVMDNDLHRNYTGTDNRIILDNARKMSRMGKDLIIRVPVVPDMNNDWINLSATCKFAKTIGVQRVELLPYHRLGEHKYEQLGRSYPLKNLKTQKMEELADIASKLRDKFSINVEVIQ